MSSFPSLLAQFNGQVLPGAVGKIVDVNDITALTPLAGLTDLTGIPLTEGILTASGIGVLPAFRTPDYRAAVSWVSGAYRMDIPALDIMPEGPQPGQVLAWSGTTLTWVTPALSGGGGGDGTGASPTLANLPGGSVVTRIHNGTTYPVRGTTRTDIVVRWRGPVPPTVGGSFAVEGVDEWVNTQP